MKNVPTNSAAAFLTSSEALPLGRVFHLRRSRGKERDCGFVELRKAGGRLTRYEQLVGDHRAIFPDGSGIGEIGPQRGRGRHLAAAHVVGLDQYPRRVTDRGNG